MSNMRSNTKGVVTRPAERTARRTESRFENSVFEALAVRFSELQRNVLNILSDRLRELEERYREVYTEDVGTRLSHQPMRLFTQVGQRTNGTIEINLSREELAQLTGTTLVTVSRRLSNWRERGVLRARRETVSVQNVEALRQLAESE
jgi:CRP-like cAMP-binding protein